MTRDADGVLCHEYGGWYGALVSHLRFKHRMSTDEYRTAHQLPRSTPLTSFSASRKLSVSTVQGFAENPERRTRWEAARNPDAVRRLAANRPTGKGRLACALPSRPVLNDPESRRG